MSILNGQFSARNLCREATPFGEPLRLAAFVPLGRAKDVALCGTYLYVVRENALSVFTITDPEKPRLLSTLEGVGDARQLVLCGDHAYITARADGLCIVDISAQEKPRLVGFYDTLEMATGIAADKDSLFVTDRHYGVEILDRKNPEKPLFLSSFLCGEAQSVYVQNSVAYVGDWMNKRVHITDISDLRHPRKLAAFSVDGYADGVCVKDGLCFVATGHHSARLKNRMRYANYAYPTAQMIANGYGCGHGLEIFDVSNPQFPEYISSIKFPPLYCQNNDTWRVYAAHGFVFAADTYNGVFVVDVSDAFQPKIIAHYRPGSKTEPVCAPLMQSFGGAISGLAIGDGYLFAAGCEDGLHILQCAEAATEKAEAVPAVKTIMATRVFSCNGQVHSFAHIQDMLAVAAGQDGIYLLDSTLHTIKHIETSAPVYDICAHNDRLFTAEGKVGIGLYTATGELISVTSFGGNVREICVFEDSAAALHIDTGKIAAARITGDTIEVGEIIGVDGIMYKRNICKKRLHGSICANSLAHCAMTFVLQGNAMEMQFATDSETTSCPIEEGIAAAETRAVVIRNRRYALIKKPQDIQNMSFQAITGADLSGKPFLCNNLLCLLNACTATAEVLDITDEKRPVLLGKATLCHNPAFADIFNDRLLICCGHGGIFELHMDLCGRRVL